MERIYVKHVKEMRGKSENMLLIDVLSEESYEKGHLPGSVNIPFEDPRDFVQKVDERAASKQEKIVVYCAREECPLSGKAAKALDEAGYKEVFDFEGGLEAWEEAGEELE